MRDGYGFNEGVWMIKYIVTLFTEFLLNLVLLGLSHSILSFTFLWYLLCYKVWMNF